MNELTHHTSTVCLNYIEGAQNGSPVLLVHGNMGRWQAFTPILVELAEKYHVFAVDLRGHGKSSRVVNTYILQNYVLDIVSFIKNQIGKPVTLIGLSLGGMIGLMTAAHHPELIQNLIMGDSPLTLDTLRPIVESQKEFGHKIFNYLKANQIENLYKELNDDFWAESVSLCDSDIIATTFDRYEEMIAGYDINQLLPKIKCPVLMMRGEEKLGSMISDNDIDQAKKLFQSLEEKKILNVGHSLLAEKESVLTAINHFLEREGQV